MGVRPALPAASERGQLLARRAMKSSHDYQQCCRFDPDNSHLLRQRDYQASGFLGINGRMTNGLGPRMEADPWLRDTFLRDIPAGRFGQPEDIKGLPVLLASDAADWITGAIIPMHGGNLAMNGGGGLLGPILERHGLKR
jgi:hypothetical protein